MNAAHACMSGVRKERRFPRVIPVFVLGLLLATGPALLLSAEEPSTQPILRLELGMHQSYIRTISADAHPPIRVDRV